MKIFPVFLLLLFFLSPLYAVSYTSNELGQKKEETESLLDGWVLTEEGNEKTLFHDGGIVQTTIETDSLITKKKGEREERIFLDGDGTITRRIIKDGKGEEEYNYIYKNGLLSGYNYSLDGVLQERVDYITSDDGTLLYYSVNDDGVYISDSFFVHSDGGSVALSRFNGGEQGVRETLSDGGYRETDGGYTLYYDSNGRLRKEESDQKTIDYTYASSGELEEKREEDENAIYITTYGDEILYTRYDKSGVKLLERRTLENGEIEEKRFIDGAVRYIFIYDRDGRRIKEVKAL